MPVVTCEGLRPCNLHLVCFSMSIVVLLVQFLFWQPLWWDLMGMASDITKRHNLTAHSLILKLTQTILLSPLHQCSLSVRNRPNVMLKYSPLNQCSLNLRFRHNVMVKYSMPSSWTLYLMPTDKQSIVSELCLVSELSWDIWMWVQATSSEAGKMPTLPGFDERSTVRARGSHLSGQLAEVCTFVVKYSRD